MATDLIEFVGISFSFFMVLVFCLGRLRQLYSRWWLDTHEYYAVSQDRNGNEFIQWFNLSLSKKDGE